MKRSVLSFSTTFGAALMLALTLFTSFAPAAQAASSSTSLEYAGWIPYWATAKGTTDARAHLSQMTELNPFGYTVRGDGTLYDAMRLSDDAWQSLFRDARKADVKVIPTIMWSDTGAIYNTLSNPSARAAHIQSIVSAVKENKFDGIDIDYEGKSAETREGFSAFLTELSTALYQADKDLQLNCTIEARMPLEARYSGTPPANIEYANDLPTINKVCDRVRIMTYDQQTADVQLNAAHSKELYAPVADTVWVEKVVKYMSKDLDKNKMLIGVATYGGEYQAMSNVGGNGFTYTKTSSFNPQYALNIAQQYGITPSRGASGELSLSYVDMNQTTALPTHSELTSYAPKGTSSGMLAALGALAYAKDKNRQAPVTYLTWSDAQAIGDKAALAKRMGVAGIAIFKIDGSSDPEMWNVLAREGKPVLNPSISRVINTDSTTSAPVPSAPSTPTTTPSSTPSTPPQSIPSNPGSAAFTKDLQYGNNNADVARLQGILIKKGYMKVAANGKFGPATKAAVIAWQKSVGLPSTGYFGPLSRAKIGS